MSAKNTWISYECKVERLRECPLPRQLRRCETPRQAVEYWRRFVVNHAAYNAEVECLFVLMLNTRRRVTGHYLVSVGTLDTLVIHPREVFRAAVCANAAAVIVMHSHPSGDPTPSACDFSGTRVLIAAGETLKIDPLDHVIIGGRRYASLREHGLWDKEKQPCKRVVEIPGPVVSRRIEWN